MSEYVTIVWALLTIFFGANLGLAIVHYLKRNYYTSVFSTSVSSFMGGAMW